KPRPVFKNGPLERRPVGRVKRFTRSSGTGSDRFRFGFAAIELADDIGANAPERLLVGFRFLAFAVSAFVRGAHETALDEHVRTFLDRRRDVFGEPRPEHADAVPLGPIKGDVKRKDLSTGSVPGRFPASSPTA